MWINLPFVWIIIGFASLLVELIWIPGIGFLFLGLGALTNAILISNFYEIIPYQYISFGLLSFTWFSLLWWPLKKMVYGKKVGREYFDMIGKDVEIWGQELKPGSIGQVKFSGTIMNAKLDEYYLSSVPIGTYLKIKAIEGNILIIS